LNAVLCCGVLRAGDFGLARLLMGNIYIRNRSGSGTVAYQAPEVFVEGSKLTPAVDVYSFGIMMYELYSCRRPYPGLGKDTIANRWVAEYVCNIGREVPFEEQGS
jgi:serine/threonine-protein kinase